MTIFLRLMSLVSLLSFSAATVCAATYTAEYEFSEPQFKKYSNGTQLVTLPETMLDSRSIGAPLLPMRFSNIYIPENEKVVDIQIETADPLLLSSLYNIMPVQQPYPIGEKAEPTLPDPEIYDANSNYPGVLHEWNRMKMVKGINIAQTRLFPLQYNPVQGTLEFYRSIRVTLITEEQSEMMPAMSMENKVRYRNNKADDMAIINAIDNQDDFSVMQPAAAMVEDDIETREYVVITTAAMAMAFQELTDYRETQAGGGYTTHIETMENIEANYDGRDRAEQVRNFIIEQYNNYGTQFVLLGGDADGEQENHLVPTRGAYVKANGYTDDNIITDYYYACLDGDWNGDNDELWGESNDGIDEGDIDWDPEIAIGRIPADSVAEAMNQINKIIAFEMLDTSPYRALLAGEILDKDRYGGWDLDMVYKNTNYMPADRLYDRSPYQDKWKKSELIHLINSDNYNILLHFGHSSVHGNMRMTNYGDNGNDIDLLQNRVPILAYSGGCYAASYDNRVSATNRYSSIDSIAEALTVESKNGAFAYLGNSRYGWYSPVSPNPYTSTQAMLSSFVDSLLGQKAHNRIGQALNRAKYVHDYDNGLMRWDGFDLNLLGDPASKINENCPDNELVVSYAGQKTNVSAAPLSPYIININNPTVIKASVNKACGDSFVNANVVANFDSSYEPLILNDNGVDGDDVPHDGIYSATWIPNTPIENVVMTLTASAEGFVSASDIFSFQVLNEWEYVFDDTVAYEWIDITDGQALNMPGKYKGRFVEIGFDFWFYDDLYDRFLIYPQGFLSSIPQPDLESGLLAVSSKKIPSLQGPNGMISALHSWFGYDGNPQAGSIYTKTIGSAPSRMFVVTWQDVMMQGSYPITFQAILFERTGQIKYQYKNLYTGQESSSYGIQSLVGIENNEGTYGHQYSNPESSILINDETAILITPNNYVEKDICIDNTATNSEHESEDRAFSITENVGQICFGTFCWGGYSETTWYAVGSEDNLGTKADNVITLREENVGSGIYQLGKCSWSQSPVIENFHIEVINNDVSISGKITDVNNDLKKVRVVFESVEPNCIGTYEFTCTINNLDPGVYSALLTSYDYKGNKSQPEGIEFIVHELAAPEIIVDEVVVKNSILYVNGSVIDINNDQQVVLLGLNEIGDPAVICEIVDAKFRCEFDVSNYKEGSHTLPMAAVDSYGQLSEIVIVSFDIKNEKSPIIDSFDYYVREQNLTVTGMASDPDDDLSHIQLEYANGEAVYDCTGTYDFECLILDHEVGEFDFVIAAYDEAGNRSESDVFTVEFLSAECIKDTNENHLDAGRAVKKYYYLYYATGTEDFLGYSMNTTSLQKVPSQGWQKVSSCE